MADMKGISDAGFQEKLLSGEASAWECLLREVTSRFHRPDLAGLSGEDCVAEALVRFQACLIAGRVNPAQSPVPYVLSIAANLWVDHRRKYWREITPDKPAGPEHAPPASGVGEPHTHQTPSSILESQEERARRMREAVGVLRAFSESDGPAAAFRALQAMVLSTGALQQAWRHTPEGASLRTTQRHRRSCLEKARSLHLAGRGAPDRPFLPSGNAPPEDE